MKREYVKPVMESEAFVANEYVAACWVVECDKDGIEGAFCFYGENLVKGGDKYKALDDYLKYNASGSLHKGKALGWSDCSNENTSTYYHNPDYGKCHEVKVTDCKEISKYSNTPNISG